jgi:hypothetical protein
VLGVIHRSQRVSHARESAPDRALEVLGERKRREEGPARGDVVLFTRNVKPDGGRARPRSMLVLVSVRAPPCRGSLRDWPPAFLSGGATLLFPPVSTYFQPLGACAASPMPSPAPFGVSTW